MASSKLDRVLFGDTTDELFTGGLELMGTWEVARFLGVERSRIARWLDDLAKGKESISPPVARLKSGPFWTRKQVMAKARQMHQHEVKASKTTLALDEWLHERREARASREPVAAS